MVTTIIGIDCAVQEENVGLALGSFDGRTKPRLEKVASGAEAPIAETVCGWIANASSVLIALDAPLGWPAELGPALAAHRAGAPISVLPNQMFRRLTDRVVKDKIGKQSLDVGADRIARTAHAALDLLQNLREGSGKAIPLAWKPLGEAEVGAIEVYPAATLAAYQVDKAAISGYKQKDGQAQRQALLNLLEPHIALPDDRRLMVGNDDVLDAAICVLAGADFLRGPVIAPTDIETAEKEGWIWVRKPAPGEAQ